MTTGCEEDAGTERRGHRRGPFHGEGMTVRVPIKPRRECAFATHHALCLHGDLVVGPLQALARHETQPGLTVPLCWPGRSPNLSPKLNRRELLVAGGAVGAAMAAVSAAGNQAEAGVELGRYARRAGVQGKMTGAQAAAAALLL